MEVNLPVLPRINQR